MWFDMTGHSDTMENLMINQKILSFAVGEEFIRHKFSQNT